MFILVWSTTESSKTTFLAKLVHKYQVENHTETPKVSTRSLQYHHKHNKYFGKPKNTRLELFSEILMLYKFTQWSGFLSLTAHQRNTLTAPEKDVTRFLFPCYSEAKN